MDMFKKDIAQTWLEYKLAIVSLSLLTYLLTFVSIIAGGGFQTEMFPVVETRARKRRYTRREN